MIHCVYVEPSARGRGVSRALIEAAVALARSEGAASVLAFPIPDDRRHAYPPDISEFSGRMSTFRGLGFAARERMDGFYQVMEKRLHP